jgi:hypothetical protein
MDERSTDNPDTAESLGVVIEEYRSLRQEILLSLQQGHSVLQFGLATAAILLGLATQKLSTGIASVVLTVVVVPLVTLLVVVIWTGELRRTMRVGWYLAHEVEPRTRAAFPNVALSPLRWESWLRDDHRRHFTDTYWAVPLLLCLVGVASAAIGLSELFARFAIWWCVLAILFDIVVLGATLGVFIRTRQVVQTLDADSTPVWDTARARNRVNNPRLE